MSLSGRKPATEAIEADRYFRVRNHALDSTLTSKPDPLGCVAPADRAGVLQTARAVLADITRWTANYPVMGHPGDISSRATYSSLHYATAFASGTRQQAFELAALTLVVFSLDDLMDGVLGTHTHPEIEEFARACKNALSDPSAGDGLAPDDRLVVQALHDIFSRLARYSAFDWARDYLAASWAQCIDAMRQETRWRLRLDPPPSYDRYIENGDFSIFTPAFAAVYVIVTDVPGLTPPEHGAWTTAVLHATRAVRLCNDLRSAAREELEGTPNAYALLLDEGKSPHQATGSLLAAAQQAMTSLHMTARPLPSKLHAAREALINATHFYCNWVLNQDTHNYLPEDLDRRARSETQPRAR
ncbi:terpene synthase family protein [Embleya sp. NPDC001921]